MRQWRINNRTCIFCPTLTQARGATIPCSTVTLGEAASRALAPSSLVAPAPVASYVRTASGAIRARHSLLRVRSTQQAQPLPTITRPMQMAPKPSPLTSEPTPPATSAVTLVPAHATPPAPICNQLPAVGGSAARTIQSRPQAIGQCRSPTSAPKQPPSSSPPPPPSRSVAEPKKSGNIVFDTENDVYRFACPHCGGLIEVRRGDINCTIFRHASDLCGQQVNPHLSREECEAGVAAGRFRGCGKPFLFTGSRVETCDYK